MKLAYAEHRLLQILQARGSGTRRYKIARTPVILQYCSEKLLDLLEAIFADDQTISMCLMDFVVGLLGRYPYEDEIASLEFKLTHSDLTQFLQSFFQGSTEETFTQIAQTVEVEIAKADYIYYDVSATIDLPFMSGIQRVVRSLATEASKHNLKMKPFALRLPYFPTAVREVELTKLTHFEEKVFDKNFSEHGYLVPSFSRNLKMFIKAIKIGLWHFLDAAPNGKAILQHIRRIKQKLIYWIRSPGDHRNPKLLYLKNTAVLQPECALEEERISWYMGYIPWSGSKFTLICYDLIPLTFPETCAVISGPFVNYLRLFRIADAVTCISQSVQEEISRFLPLIRSQKQLPDLQFHWLGSSFATKVEQSALDASEPIILVVGTLEPRKNHLMIARAALALHRRGLRFRLVFAGRVGWKQQLAMNEYRWMMTQGLQLEIRNGLSDAELELLYNKCLFTMLCSYSEGFGLPIVESLQKGKPCVVSNLGSMKELADGLGGCLTVDPRSVESISNAMATLLTQAEVRRSLIEKQCSIEKIPNWLKYTEHVFDVASRR